MSIFRSDKSLSEKAKIAPNISFMWNSDSEKVEWMHTMGQLDERGKDFVTSVLYERAETKLKLRHYIDPNFYFGAADCFIYPYNHNPDLNEFKATLQRNIMALKSTIKRIEESKKRKRSTSNISTSQANPTKKIKHTSAPKNQKEPETSPKQPEKTVPERNPQGKPRSPITTPNLKTKPSSSPKTPETLRRLRLTRFVDPCKPKSKLKTPFNKITLGTGKQSVPQSVPQLVPQSAPPSAPQPVNTISNNNPKITKNLLTPIEIPDKTSSDSDSSAIETPKNKQTNDKELSQPSSLDPNSPTLELIPQDICSDIVFADKIKEKLHQEDLKFIEGNEINKVILKDTYDSLKELGIKNEYQMASKYRKRLYNIKRYLKNKSITEKGNKYLQELLEYDIKRMYLCSVEKKGTIPPVCSHMTETKKEMETHIQSKHGKIKKSKATYNPVLLYKDEAKDLRRIIQKRDEKNKGK